MNLKKYFYQEIWNIGIYRKSNELTLSALNQLCNDKDIHWLTEQFHFQADPFLVEVGDKIFVFYEALNHTWVKGHLRCRVLDAQMNKLEDFALDDINSLGCHLSFPQVYKIDGQFYLMPESHENQAIYLFQAIDFPRKWQKVNTIANTESIDSVLYQQLDSNQLTDQPRFWVISSDKKTLKRQLFTSCHLTGDWEMVALPSDMIQADNLHQRLGGGIIEFKEAPTQLYLPIQQNHPKEYGKSLFIKQIALPKLAQNSHQPLSAWQEKTLFEIVSQSQRYPDGIHTLNVSENFVIIDAKRWAFQPFNFFVRKFRQLRQLLSK